MKKQGMKRFEGNGFRKHIFVLHDAFTYNFIYPRYYELEAGID